MNSILLTVALVAVIGLVGSIILVVGSRAFAVEEDERLPELVAILPGANCGSCGYPGCEGYAKAMLDGAPVNSCGPGGAAVAAKLAEYLGVDAGDVAVKRAIVGCRGAKDRLVMKERETYEGAPSCRVFATMNHISSSCTDGCIGFGDCVAECPYGALSLNENSVAVVDPVVCVGCGLCTTICPRHLISLQEKNARRRGVVRPVPQHAHGQEGQGGLRQHVPWLPQVREGLPQRLHHGREQRRARRHHQLHRLRQVPRGLPGRRPQPHGLGGQAGGVDPTHTPAHMSPN